MDRHCVVSLQGQSCLRIMALFLFAALLALGTPCLIGESVPCESLAKLKLENTVITSAKSVSGGPFTVRDSGPPSQVNLPAHCSITGSIHPSSDSDIEFEVWLPVKWNGRFEAVGNGGLAGAISTQAMTEALRDGYATASTDTGHKGTPITGDWALGHPEKIIDFGYRAVHLLTVQAKALIYKYYGTAPRYSYWNGCSEGGGQALSEAQRFPGDYNGIIAGAPANYLVHLQAGGNWISQAIHIDPATFIPADKLPSISAAVLAQCDAADGVKDGVIEDPRTCHFDPSVLECKGADSSSCLTESQIEGLKKVYAGAKNQRTGEQVFPGYMRGSEILWGFWIAGTEVPPGDFQHAIMAAFFANFVFDDPHWDWKSFDFDKDVAFADKKIGAIVNQINPDLSAFRMHGGKLLQYHGWSDPAISPLNSVDYFESVQKKMGDTQSFYRLFMAPGMGHCAGGPGPNTFDKMTVIVDWVEHGKAPNRIVASRPGRTRPLCAYPEVAKYKGTGSIDDAANFVCARP